MKWEAVFWDFDGVVLDSVHVKTRAFAKMFQKYGAEVEQAVVAYHLENGGVSRFEKFRYFYNQLLHRPIHEEELQRLGDEFSGLALQGVLAAPFIPGAMEALKNLRDKGIPAFVVSGTPEAEVQDIVRRRKLEDYFQEVHGSPRKKDEILIEVFQRKDFSPEKCLFLGDAMTDYHAAIKTGVNFIGVVAKNEISPFPAGTQTIDCIKV